jgi:hypothetical protein
MVRLLGYLCVSSKGFWKVDFNAQVGPDGDGSRRDVFLVEMKNVQNIHSE